MNDGSSQLSEGKEGSMNVRDDMAGLTVDPFSNERASVRLATEAALEEARKIMMTESDAETYDSVDDFFTALDD